MISTNFQFLFWQNLHSSCADNGSIIIPTSWIIFPREGWSPPSPFRPIAHDLSDILNHNVISVTLLPGPFHPSYLGPLCYLQSRANHRSSEVLWNRSKLPLHLSLHVKTVYQEWNGVIWLQVTFQKFYFACLYYEQFGQSYIQTE